MNASRYSSMRPGQIWLDSKGKRIQAHGGWLPEQYGAFYWYGENEERTKPGTDIWHWAARCYRSADLYTWDDLANDFLGPWSIVRTGLRPLGMNAGDFDLVLDSDDCKGHYSFERVHTELICADLTDELTCVTGY